MTANPRPLAIIAVVLLALGGCSAGQVAETAQVRPSIEGVNVDAGAAQLRNLLVPYRAGGYPAGAEVPLVVRVFNGSTAPIQLTAADPGTATGADTVQPARVEMRNGTLPVTVGPTGCALLVPPDGAYLAAVQVAAPLQPGFKVAVRFTFSTGAADVAVPMAPPDLPLAGSLPAASAEALCNNPDQ